ncbi:putative high affinity immunoglobulin gamma Fc receptor IB [Maylandia zebra]|uniref:putative high affinity immunoglobulin gamma Fc receptor IB n=1 Tax=Maylandia zebra TaxID=106582 RepID=UPI00403D48E1
MLLSEVITKLTAQLTSGQIRVGNLRLFRPSAVAPANFGFNVVVKTGTASLCGVCEAAIPSKPTVTLQPSWPQIYSGETVTVRCEIQGGEGAQWTYEWRAAKLNTPPTSNEYRIIRATESDSGGYSCRGRRDYFFSGWSDIITLTVSFPSKPTVTLQPSWPQIYSGETVTVRCEIQGGEGAQWTYEWRAAKLNTPPTSNEYRIIRATESDSGGYSCRGRRDYFFSGWSDIITLTVSCKIFHPDYFKLLIVLI